jgi:hypothetical protein
MPQYNAMLTLFSSFSIMCLCLKQTNTMSDMACNAKNANGKYVKYNEAMKVFYFTIIHK